MARKRATVSLSDNDWGSLFPITEHSIGNTTLNLEPLSLESLAFIVERLGIVSSEFKELSLSIEDFASSDSTQMISLIQLIVTKAPEILSEMSGLVVADVKSLPLSESVALFNKCLDVNIESQDDLVKNFKELGMKFQKFTQPGTMPERAKLSPAPKSH
ncbi:MAG: hypothetical protein DRN17_05400 [Thermoplasmata archaeon]|nr:MAG: hypothetical protein DRN17_05400 [Thermoplasmata archaeon]